jgi:signal transduction histidine kinase
MGPKAMLEPIGDSAALAWPLALSIATLAIADRRRVARRRQGLGRAMHELRRPLQALVMLGEAPGRRDQRALSRHLELALDALRELEAELDERPARPPRRSACEARELADAAVHRWETLAARFGRRLELRWSAGEAFLHCDAARVGRALDNLIANALEHGGGTIRLVATRSPGGLRLAVRDEGRGAAGHGAVVAHGHGNGDGLGLGIARAIAAEHGGSLRLDPNGSGCEARIELPLAG